MKRWHVERDGRARTVTVIRDSDACTIATIEPRAAGATPSSDQAAMLIAAAPDLLAALKDITENRPGERPADWLEVAEAAIAKAEGR